MVAVRPGIVRSGRGQLQEEGALLVVRGVATQEVHGMVADGIGEVARLGRLPGVRGGAPGLVIELPDGRIEIAASAEAMEIGRASCRDRGTGTMAAASWTRRR